MVLKGPQGPKRVPNGQKHHDHDLFFIEIWFFDTQNTFHLIVKGLKMHFSCPCRGCENKGLASCKWWSGGTSLLQMVIWSGRPLANDDPEGPASCRWSFGGAGLLQMMIRRDRPLADGHPEGLASCKWWYGGTGLLQMVIRNWKELACIFPHHLLGRHKEIVFSWCAQSYQKPTPSFGSS